ncbi:hypothetical protein [Nonomuraea antimicrobica]|uniref:hypothetical protein n=1 Tax=Nonomuraea antimicrobica TaxID=561173 RepID=UPI003CD06AAD
MDGRPSGHLTKFGLSRVRPLPHGLNPPLPSGGPLPPLASPSPRLRTLHTPGVFRQKPDLPASPLQETRASLTEVEVVRAKWAAAGP